MAVALATLAQVKGWLGATTNTDDAALSRLITQITGAIFASLNRPAVLPQSYVENYDGKGGSTLLLRNFPVTSVESLLIDGLAVSPAGASGYGFVADLSDGSSDAGMSKIALRGWLFNRGMINVQVGYTAGYRVTDEPAIVTSAPVTPFQYYGPWGSDLCVKYASGAALARVSGSPAAGQYAVDDAGNYTFSAADLNASVAISYGFIPTNLNLACVEWVAERWKYRERIGQRSKSLGGQETVSYDLSAMPGIVKELLPNFRRVVPC